jgi:HSP20 family molecular chaperone IbpA
MADKTESRNLQKREVETPTSVERTSTQPVFVPPTDIYETEDAVVLVADMPGVGEKDVDVQLEQGVLTIRGHVTPEDHEGFQPAYGEYRVGDYERSFTLSDEVDPEGIDATLKNGVLRLDLRKKEEVKPKKIAVNTA